jgi:hypothetical protein
MKNNVCWSATFILAVASLCAAETNSTDRVSSAVARLGAAANYNWTTTVKIADMPFEAGPVKGSTEKGGYSRVSQVFNENTIDVIFKGEKVVVKDETGWQLANQAEGMGAMMAGWLTGNGTAGEEAANLIKHIKSLESREDGVLSGEFTPDGAKELLTFRPRGGNPSPAPKNAKGSAKFWIKEGALTKFESRLQGAVAFAPDQEEQELDMTRTVEIQNVGTAKVEVPDSARQKIESK